MKAFASSLAAAALVGGIAGLLSVVAPPAAAQTQSDATIHEKYLADRAACLSGRTGEDQKACLREAGAAAQAARQGKLLEGADENYRRNALARCAPLPPEQREACRMRIEGAGSVTGSVEGGGLFRELTIRESAPQATTAPASAPPAASSSPAAASASTSSAAGAATTTVVPPSPATPPVVVPGAAPVTVAPAPSATTPPVGSIGGPTFTPVQPVVPGRAAPATSASPVPAPSVQSAENGTTSSSLQITPPSTPVMQAPPPPTFTLQPAEPSPAPPAPEPVLVAPGSVPAGGAR